MIKSKCCFTGHRQIDEKDIPMLEKKLMKEVERLIRKGIMFFFTGGALGFDTLAALTVIKLKQKYPRIQLVLALPCKGQADRWKTEDRILYERIKYLADNVIYTSPYYFDGCMQVRNRYLVNHSDICISYQKRQTGGTSYTVNYCKEKGIPVINLADKIR